MIGQVLMPSVLWLGLGLRLATPISTIFQLYRDGVLLVEETGIPDENHRPAAGH